MFDGLEWAFRLLYALVLLVPILLIIIGLLLWKVVYG